MGPCGAVVPMPTLPEVVMDAKVAVPDNAGLAERTTDPEPVEEVTPVPPRATASVPDPALPMLRAVIPDPAPVRVVALTVAAFIVPVNTSRAVCGLAVPTPTLPLAPTNRADPPELVWALNTLPVPNCLTVSAFDETAFAVSIVADEFIRVAGPGTPWLKLDMVLYSLGRFVWGRVKTGSLVQKVHYGFSSLRLKGRINFKIEMKGLVRWGHP